MANTMFPEEWWDADPKVYDGALLTLKSLITRETDSGTKDVSKIVSFYLIC